MRIERSFWEYLWSGPISLGLVLIVASILAFLAWLDAMVENQMAGIWAMWFFIGVAVIALCAGIVDYKRNG